MARSPRTKPVLKKLALLERRLHMILRMGPSRELEDVVQRSYDRWRSMDDGAKEQERSGETFDIFCSAAGGDDDFEVGRCGCYRLA